MKLLPTLLLAGIVLASASLLAQESGGNGKSPEKKFSKMDSNGDGKVSSEEFVSASKKPAMAAKKFKKADADGDGSLTLEEFKAARSKKQASEATEE